MAESFITARDAEALAWMQVFADGIAASPATYELMASDATAIQNAVNAFAAAYGDAVDPATRTPVVINLKDTERNAAEQICRQYAIGIKYNAGISDANKIAIGVRPVNPDRNPISVPASSPMLNVVGATAGSQTIRYADTNTPESGKKPFGAAQLQLFVAIGDEEAASPDAAQFYGGFTKNPIGVGFDAADDGKMATYFGRWASIKGEVGPWSFPVSMRIAVQELGRQASCRGLGEATGFVARCTAS